MFVLCVSPWIHSKGLKTPTGYPEDQGSKVKLYVLHNHFNRITKMLQLKKIIVTGMKHKCNKYVMKMKHR